ncbi:hypothetical protein NPS01_05380 [Nocardioides psychrotolerans]|uniref:Methyltransferase domain-containing protein n=1 Tax=Nocardioides psychrotolerans TaxID=1005945 RepID=A0A1I3CS77_9ACTN|nr:class I SAM-dependent methyltransferase [Nocardioides psychrotolerans]GEP36875.1 hypothetical protein NPS01_05380 [Nocardioides psychrotolerans]SFH77101.1 Methyltransferase domain-containing protein [Nocardioides psychrotolerans]
MTERALVFGSVAQAYERYRPDYPPEVVDLVVDHACRPVRTALEIGAGTGKATRVFAERGVAVTATDPDPAMLAELRRHVPATVTTVETTLEDLEASSTYDLVFAAASLHWTEPTQRWARVAGLLEPEGVFASFGGQLLLADPALEDALQAAQSPWLTDDGFPSPDGTPKDAPMRWPGSELERSDLFDEVRQHVVARRPSVPALDYVGHLSTISAYLMLTAADRQRAFDAILAVLPDEVQLSADLTRHVARRVG